MHVNTWLYKNVHSTHHELIVPYAYGALYNHPIEALFLDSIGAVVSQYATGMSCQVCVWGMGEGGEGGMACAW
jgi:sphinganine C4-monooxygenase